MRRESISFGRSSSWHRAQLHWPGVNVHKTRRLARRASHLVASLANYPFGIDGKHIVIIRASPEKVRASGRAFLGALR